MLYLNKIYCNLNSFNLNLISIISTFAGRGGIQSFKIFCDKNCRNVNGSRLFLDWNSFGFDSLELFKGNVKVSCLLAYLDIDHGQRFLTEIVYGQRLLKHNF